MKLNRAWLGLLIAALMSSAPSARAQERDPAYRLKLDVDLPIVLIAGATASSFFFLPELPGTTCAPNCDKKQINRFDRFAAGNYDRSWTTVGDIAAASTLMMPLVVVFVLGWITFGAGLAGSALVGVSRVISGGHFPSDVLAGAAVGVGVGLAVPGFHDRPLRIEPVAGANYDGLLVAGAF